MERQKYKDLLLWKEKRHRKPLLIKGARQVGKTWLIQEFGKREFSHLAYFNFEGNPQLSSLFEGELNPHHLIESLSALLGSKISASSLIVFDEIQNSAEALTSLKYFQEMAPEYYVIGAGSLLGVAVGIQSSFPVGKVEFLNLYPLSFEEFLWAQGEELLAEQLLPQQNFTPLPEAIHDKLMNYYRFYLYLGGMPEVVSNYMNERDVNLSRQLQTGILQAYEEDFSKYTTRSESMRISDIWKSAPVQLAKENKKFKYSDAKKGGRASQFESAITWLKKSGLIHLAHFIKTPKLPLKGYADYSKFKLFISDVGLLAASLEISSDTIVTGSLILSEYHGAFIENAVANSLIANGGENLYYWANASKAEVDFILQIQNDIIPIEVKSGYNRNTKSIRSYSNKYSPSLICRLSPRNITLDEDFLNLPLYASDKIHKWLELALKH